MITIHCERKRKAFRLEWIVDLRQHVPFGLLDWFQWPRANTIYEGDNGNRTGEVSNN